MSGGTHRDDPDVIRARMVAWIKGHDASYKPGSGPFSISLVQWMDGPSGSLTTLEYYPYIPNELGGTGENRNKESAEKLAGEFFEIAQDDTEKSGMITRYALTSDGRIEFHFVPSPDKMRRVDEQMFDEAATDRGAHFQQMRHNEAILRLALTHAEAQAEQSRRVIDAQRAEIEQLYKDRREQVKTYEELLSIRHERDMEIRQMEAEDKRMARAGDMIAPMVPLLLNKAMGAKLLPETVAPQFEVLRNAVAGVSREQFYKMLEILEPAQRVVFIELFKMVEDDRQAREDAEKKAANGVAGEAAAAPEEVEKEEVAHGA
jgi:hypothetical protein